MKICGLCCSFECQVYWATVHTYWSWTVICTPMIPPQPKRPCASTLIPHSLPPWLSFSFLRCSTISTPTISTAANSERFSRYIWSSHQCGPSHYLLLKGLPMVVYYCTPALSTHRELSYDFTQQITPIKLLAQVSQDFKWGSHLDWPQGATNSILWPTNFSISFTGTWFM